MWPRSSASRTLDYVRLSSESILLCFADGRPFIEVDLSEGTCSRTHDCGEDVYEIEMALISDDLVEERWRVIRLAFDSPPKDASEEEKLAYEARNVAVFNGPNFLPPEAELRERVRQLAERSNYPAGMLRQFDALLGTGNLRTYSRAITAPTVVLHGSRDPMVRPRNGRAVAAAIPGARFVVIDGMGHDLPEPVWRPILEALTENFARVGVR